MNKLAQMTKAAMGRIGFVAKAEAQARVNAAREEDIVARTDPPLWGAYNSDVRPGMVPNSILRHFARTCEPIQLFVTKTRWNIDSLDFDIVPDLPKGATDAEITEAERQCEQGREWFTTGGGIGSPGKPIYEVSGELIEDRLVIGATVLYKRPSVGAKLGLSGSPAVVSIEPLDAAKFIPLRDGKGWIPQPPAPAYQQRLRNGTVKNFTRDKVRYRMLDSTTYSNYGKSLVESVLSSVLQFQAADRYNLVWFTDGDDIRGQWVWTGPGELMPDQFKSFEAWVAKKRKSKKDARTWNTPPGWKYVSFAPRSEAEYTQTQKFLIQRIAPFFGFSATSAGFDTAGFKASAEAMNEAAAKAATKPTARFLNRLYTDVLQEDLGLPLARFAYDIGEVDAKGASEWTNRAGRVIVSPNEAREKVGLPRKEGGFMDDHFQLTNQGVFIAWSPDKQPGLIPIAGGPKGANNTGNAAGDAGSTGADTSAGSSDTGDGTGTPGEPIAKAGIDLAPDARADLRRWRTKARKAERKQEQGQVRFVSEIIPEPIAKAVQEGLQGVETVDAVFAPYLEPARATGGADALAEGLEWLVDEIEQR